MLSTSIFAAKPPPHVWWRCRFINGLTNIFTRTEGAGMYPLDFRYTKDHEWIKVDGGTATVGITQYAQEQLGDVVFAELPKVGSKLNAGQAFGTVESVKAVK